MRSVFGAIGAATVRAAGMRFGGVERVSVVVGSAALLLSAGAAMGAEFKSVIPYHVVVTADGAAMRCADLSNSYAVHLLKPGDVLRVDGERSGWLRVEYPAGTRAWVHAKDARMESDGKTLRLSQASTLMALNVSGVRPWWPLFEKDVAAGTTFADAQAITSADGVVDGYSVPAPAQARGYVRAEQVKKATPEQVSAAMAAPAATAPAVASKPADKPTERPAAQPPALAATTSSSSSTPTPAPSAATATNTPGANPLPAVNPPPAQPISLDKSFAPAGNEENRRVGTTEGVPTVGTAPVAPAPSAPVATTKGASTPDAAPEVTRLIQDLALLRDMFDRVMKPGTDETEIGTVEREFERTMAGLGLSQDDQRLRLELNKRLDALRLKRQVAEARQQAQAAGTAFDQRTQSIRVAMQEVERQAVYTIVGTMIPSTVYDGRRGMPLMWRIESPDVTSTRTVGYVLPREGLDLITKTGRVVGIIGESRMDPALGVTIVMPRRVDVLRFVEGRYQVESSESLSGESRPSIAPQQPPAMPEEIGAGDPQ